MDIKDILNKWGVTFTFPLVIGIGIYFFEKKIEIQNQENKILQSENTYLKLVVNTTSYSSALSELKSQEELHKREIIKIKKKYVDAEIALRNQNLSTKNIDPNYKEKETSL